MRYEELQLRLLKLLKPYWQRVISFDVETNVLNPNEFLTNERILSMSICRRVGSNFMEPSDIETKTLFLQKEDDDSEIKLLGELDRELGKIKPLGVIGYGIRQYDIPLLITKKQHYSLLLWKLIDMTESTIPIDLYHLLKNKGYRKLDDAVESDEFKDLPLKRTKNTFPSDREKKGKAIYEAWQKDREKLRKYGEGDVHDVLLIAEKLME